MKFKVFLYNLKLIINIKFIKSIILSSKESSIINYFIDQKYYIKKKNETYFSIRNNGGSTLSRGKNFFNREIKTLSWIESFEKHSVFIDIGSNIGLFSLYAAYNKNSVISIEPEALNFAQLNLNIYDNKFNDKIKAYSIALNNENSFGYLNISNFNWGKSNHSFGISDNKKNYLQGCSSFTLDYFVNKLKIKPNYIKIDVDGNEIKILEGMKDILHIKSLKSILIEVNKNSKNYILINDLFKKNEFIQVDEEKIEEDIYNIIFKKLNTE